MYSDDQRRAGYGRGFTLSDHADWPGLLRSIEDTGAKRVIAMHGDTSYLLAHLNAQGIAAEEISIKDTPPR
jgi:putative mRNA 3-end processing factor